MTRTEETREPFDLEIFLKAFTNHLKLVVGGVIFFTLVTFLVTITLIPKQYDSKAVILPPQASSLGLSGFASILGGAVVPSEIIATMLKSRTTARIVVDSLKLHELWGVEKETAVDRVNKKLKVSVDVLSKVIRVSYRDRNPQMAQKILQLHLSTVEELNNKLQLSVEKPFVKVLDPPDLPRKKSFPKTSIFTMIGTLVSFLFFFSLALFLEIKNEKIRNPGDFTSNFKIPILGRINRKNEFKPLEPYTLNPREKVFFVSPTPLDFDTKIFDNKVELLLGRDITTKKENLSNNNLILLVKLKRSKIKEIQEFLNFLQKENLKVQGTILLE